MQMIDIFSFRNTASRLLMYKTDSTFLVNTRDIREKFGFENLGIAACFGFGRYVAFIMEGDAPDPSGCIKRACHLKEVCTIGACLADG